MSCRGKDRDERGVWQLRVSLGYDADTQTYPKVTEQFHGPTTNARSRLHDLERDQDDGELSTSSSQSLGEHLELWLKDLGARDLAAHTRQEYRSTTRRYLIPRLGHLRLRALSAEHIDAMLAKLSEEQLCPPHVAQGEDGPLIGTVQGTRAPAGASAPAALDHAAMGQGAEERARAGGDAISRPGSHARDAAASRERQC
jgi:hypothetical protein